MATLSAQQFLTEDRNGEPALLAGELRLPARGADPYPAVLLVHGSGGTRANIDFSFHDHCVTHDAHTGYNAQAHAQSVKDVTAFLAQALRLKDYA